MSPVLACPRHSPLLAPLMAWEAAAVKASAADVRAGRVVDALRRLQRAADRPSRR